MSNYERLGNSFGATFYLLAEIKLHQWILPLDTRPIYRRKEWVRYEA